MVSEIDEETKEEEKRKKKERKYEGEAKRKEKKAPKYRYLHVSAVRSRIDHSFMLFRIIPNFLSLSLTYEVLYIINKVKPSSKDQG